MTMLTLRKKDSGLSKLHNEIDDLFSSFFGGFESAAANSYLRPAVDIQDNEKEFVLTAEVPGCKPEDVDMSIQGDTLTITGEKKQSTETNEKGYHHMERIYGSFRRDFTLPGNIDQSKIKASCKNGLLMVTIPKAEEEKPTKIQVKSED